MNDKAATLEKAILLATQAHAGQTDKAGAPYILHPLAVMHRFAVTDFNAQAVAVLHDVIEDTEVTANDLLEAGIPGHVVRAVSDISKRDGEDYGDYLERVKANPLARRVKLEDIGHNMSRLDNLSPRHAGYLAAKYTRALKFLRASE